jgi:hypothetical protein
MRAGAKARRPLPAVVVRRRGKQRLLHREGSRREHWSKAAAVPRPLKGMAPTNGGQCVSGGIARPFHAEALYLPLAVIGTASLPSQPSLGLPAHIAREEIAADQGALGIRRGERCDVAASAGVWVSSGDAIIHVAPGKRGGGYCARISKIDIRRLRVLLSPGVRLTLCSERIELVSAVANGKRAEQSG